MQQDGTMVLALARGLEKVGWDETAARIEALKVLDDGDLPRGDDVDELAGALAEIVAARVRSNQGEAREPGQ
jgi:hypothetical protein